LVAYRVEHGAALVALLSLGRGVCHDHGMGQRVQVHSMVVLPVDGLLEEGQWAQVGLLQQGVGEVAPHRVCACRFALCVQQWQGVL